MVHRLVCILQDHLHFVEIVATKCALQIVATLRAAAQLDANNNTVTLSVLEKRLSLLDDRLRCNRACQNHYTIDDALDQTSEMHGVSTASDDDRGIPVAPRHGHKSTNTHTHDGRAIDALIDSCAMLSTTIYATYEAGTSTMTLISEFLVCTVSMICSSKSM